MRCRGYHSSAFSLEIHSLISISIELDDSLLYLSVVCGVDTLEPHRVKFLRVPGEFSDGTSHDLDTLDRISSRPLDTDHSGLFDECSGWSHRDVVATDDVLFADSHGPVRIVPSVHDRVVREKRIVVSRHPRACGIAEGEPRKDADT